MAFQDLLDKALPNGSDMTLSGSGDILMVSGNDTLLQTAQNRCLSIFRSWLHDLNFGSTLYDYLKTHSVWQLTDDIVKQHTEKALHQMIVDGRISDLRSVRIVERSSDSLLLEVVVDLGTQIGTITYEVTF